MQPTLNNSCTVFWIAAVPLLAFHLSQLQPQNASPQTPRTGRIDTPLNTNDFVEDLSKGAVFRFQIATGLPLFTFKIIPDVKDEENGFPQSTVSSIEVFKADSAQRLQTLDGCDFKEMGAPDRNSDWLRTDDFNFDGYQDIFLVTDRGATGNESGCVWLHDPATQKFGYSTALSHLATYWLDPAHKIIRTYEKSGMAGIVYTANKYKMDGNQPTLIWSQSQDWDFKKKQFHCILQERRKKIMVTTRDVWGKGTDPPCELPSSFFGP